MATETETKKNNSFVLTGSKSVAFEDRPVPSLSDHDPHSVLLQVNYTGICGSDIHYWQHGRIGHYVVRDPMVLGHESSGTVIETGKEVTTLKVGDRVAMEPGIPCRRCYYVLPEDFCYKLPENVSLQEGALMEPLAVAVHITKQSRIRNGDKVVVFGAGPVGLLCCAVAKSFGASKVVAVDIQQNRLDFAKEFAATGVFMPEKVSAQENAERMNKEQDLGLGADVAIDASGAEPSVATAIHVLRNGGSYVQGGMGKDEITFPIMAACTKELKISGSFRYSQGDYADALQLVASGKIDVKKLITREVEFEEAQKAFEDIRDGKGIKVLIGGPK
ncbi:putative D-xylulose A [Cyphellophora attinorum]|uniref:D-xylulose reductase n=1 Tax=Cyphellophora attinorum TaxID=1664694 RepID=A0A0N1H7F8_9EURO|nr:putative D-xylulose A [Phialophora attinorum]KPI38910.1 putative D-xylulose A [Phialophora attinorum]